MQNGSLKKSSNSKQKWMRMYGTRSAPETRNHGSGKPTEKSWWRPESPRKLVPGRYSQVPKLMPSKEVSFPASPVLPGQAKEAESGSTMRYDKPPRLLLNSNSSSGLRPVKTTGSEYGELRRMASDLSASVKSVRKHPGAAMVFRWQIRRKKKKYRLRGRSSETAKAHRG
eukprot:TRINITY_DN5429_c0_g1_i1.p1 TRINITY_DN5429_c0_g1~~TRINITY_DN5429_c0_g1_i1.p1  ORF type:complete len:170 (+),score=23.06 TRINITY_DN5429_c0_g1_i1:648-1157(+)